ncbi:tetratricopeptide (TPR) repeat protein [Friedmanniella endophytica]|uniref:Tetratricopeptide (TPR) repeat protein n=1 Tax=Microlunatus kandeliicorticis TaxID=1759536 RepID=A0A7W3IU35_9ACTN|nr:hypothetical protein [Microlunatus kandeliicorticis]MBA8795281.1 tetratricopeptide (TPR) repeat protein [Microlunatus kandeliicorticis]
MPRRPSTGRPAGARPDRRDRFERPERGGRFERPERGDRFERPERPARFDRGPGADRAGDRGGRPDRGDRFDRPGRAGAPRGRAGERDQAGRRPDGRGPVEDPRSSGAGGRRPIAARADEPPTPTDADIRLLPRAVRAELRGLPKELADIVAAHLVSAGELVDVDPDLAYRHAEAARRRASRVAVVREATAETAYAAGRYDVALTEYRALRRMTGRNGFLPVMADCERALERPHAAIKLAREADGLDLDPDDRIEMRIVEAGARNDLGQTAEAIRLLRELVAQDPLRRVGARTGKVGQSQAVRVRTAMGRVHYALADLLLAEGDPASARVEFARAADLDVEETTDAHERLDELDGVSIDFDETEDEDSDETDEDSDEGDSDETDEDSDESDSDETDEHFEEGDESPEADHDGVDPEVDEDPVEDDDPDDETDGLGDDHDDDHDEDDHDEDDHEGPDPSDGEGDDHELNPADRDPEPRA